MGIWGLLNRRAFSKPGRKQNRPRREDLLRPRKRRSLRIEQFEERTLLSIGAWEPFGPSTVNYADTQVENVAPLDVEGALDGLNIIDLAIQGDTILAVVDNAESGMYADVGIYRSDDGGATFTQISDNDGNKAGLPVGSAYDLRANSTDDSVFYAAVVGADEFGDESGIYQSSDGGLTWTKMSASEVVVEAINAVAATDSLDFTAVVDETSDRVDLLEAALISDIDVTTWNGRYSHGNAADVTTQYDDPSFGEDASTYAGRTDAKATGTIYLVVDQWGGVISDAEKSPLDDDDDEMCWAAAASNILAWTGWGLVDDLYDTDDIFEYFQEHWTNDGGWGDVGWTWWFSGVDISVGWGGSEVEVAGGGFYTDLDYEDYLVEEWDESLVMSSLDEFLHDGYGCTLGLYDAVDDEAAHAITVWGFNYDVNDPDYYVGVWVTDSDDDKNMSTPPDELLYYELEWSESEGRWYMLDYYGEDNTYIGEVLGLSVLINYDFGDAPLAASELPYGAKHVVTDGVQLGDSIDSEFVPNINTGATADEGDDGVLFDDGCYVVSQSGSTKDIVVTASTDGVLDAWIDWDQSGTWDASEKVTFFDSLGNVVTEIVAGENELTFDVPAGLADAGDFNTYVRFRFSTTGLLADGSAMEPTGKALDGEVEDYRLTVVENSFDWGDAPDPTYPTLESSDGAYHTISIDDLYLGETVSFDTEAKPDATATGDADDGFDLTGVSFAKDREVTLTFNVTNETGQQAYLHAWIDFNGDGVWSADEKLDVLAVDAGENTLTVAVPVDAALGETFARFRLSTQESLSATGYGGYGEVEDYQIVIDPTPGSVQGTVWNDRNGDGVLDVDEVGASGWTVYVDSNDNGVFDEGELSAVSAADGSYEIVDVAPGDYIIRQKVNDGWSQTGPADGYYAVTVVTATAVSGIDFLDHDIAPPHVASIVCGDEAGLIDRWTNADKVYFKVQFSEPVIGVDVTDFDYIAPDLTGVEIISVTAVSDDLYVVEASTGEGDGTLELIVVDDDTIEDDMGYVLGGVGTGNGAFDDGEAYIVDNTGPTVMSISLADGSPTNSATVSYTVTFSEPVTGVDVSDFSPVFDGLTGGSVSAVTGSEDVYTVTVIVGEGNGELRLDLVDDNSIVDLAGNALIVDDGSFPGEVYEIEHIAPQVVSIDLAGHNPTADTVVYYTVTFSEEVTGVTKADFSLEHSNLAGPTVYSVTGGGDTYTVAVRTGLTQAPAEATLQLNLVDDNTIVDLAGNVLAGPAGDDGSFTGETYTIDRTKPTGIFLTNDKVAEHMAINTIVGSLSSEGPNAGEYTYELVEGEGDDDNDRFCITGGVLRTREVFNYDSANPTYTLRIRTTDSAGLSLEKVFAIAIVSEADAVSIGDLAWYDDGDGVQEAGEPGVAGVTVELICLPTGIVGDGSDYIYAQAVTDADGYYRFDYVLPDQQYYAVFHLPVGYNFTKANYGDDQTDSDADANGCTELFSFGVGEENVDLDVGLTGEAEEYDFAIRAGASNDDIGQAIATDSAGNFYVVGSFHGTVDFDPGLGVCSLTSAGGSDIFVAKYSSSGSLMWAKAMGGVGDDAATSVSVGPDDVVCVGGSFSATAEFASEGSGYSLTSTGYKDVFVMKLDSLGGLIWARGMGGVSDDVAKDIAVGSDGSVYSTGYFITRVSNTEVDFDPGDGVYNLISIGPKDIFVSKLNTDGNFVWAKRIGGIGWSQGICQGTGIAVADDDTVYITGSFQGSAYFDPDANEHVLTCVGDTDVFISKLDADGNVAWAKQIGGAYEDYGADISISYDGSVYVTGGFQGIVDFDPGAGTSNLNSAGYRRLFVVKLTSAGNFEWADGFGGTARDLAGDITVDILGDVYVTGGFTGIADFNPGSGVYSLTSAGEKDVFTLKLNSAGEFVWVQRTGGAGDDSGNGVAVSSQGAVYTTGYFHSTTDFDPSAAIYNLTSAGGRDIFLAKYIPAEVAQLTVTIDQAPTQADPAESLPIIFQVVFSAAVSDFDIDDVVLDGTTAPGALVTAVEQVDDSKTTYNIFVSGMTGMGTVVASVNAGTAHSVFGIANSASTSADNTVEFAYTSVPEISEVTLVETDENNSDGVFESNEGLTISWIEAYFSDVVSRTLTIGEEVQSVTGPDQSGCCYSDFGPLPAGNYEYTIEVIYANGLTSSKTDMFEVLEVTVPEISEVVLVETDEDDRDGVFESNEGLTISWVEIDSADVVTRTLTIDGEVQNGVVGPDQSGYCYFNFGPLAAGDHEYSIELVYAGDLPSSKTDTFEVQEVTAPEISNVALVETDVNGRDGVFESDEGLTISWVEVDSADVVTRTLTIDGEVQNGVVGPDQSGYCYFNFGPLSAGDHEYSIELVYTGDLPSSKTDTFEVQEVTAPEISNVALVETDVNGRDGVFESDEGLTISWVETDSADVVTRTLTIDGEVQNGIVGPDQSGYCYFNFGPLAAGDHEYSIELVYAGDLPSSKTDTFEVQDASTPDAPNDPIIAVGEAYVNSDGTLESDEELVVTWAEDDYTNVVSRTLTVDGQQQSQIGGPDSRGYCYSIIGTLPAGNHECKVELEYANGHTASTTTTFDVQGTAGPVAPNDPIIAVGEAYTNSDGTLESDEELVVTWAEDDYTNVVSRTLTVDGQQQSQIGGPDSRGYCYSIIGTLPAGNHECKVELEYANGHTASTTTTFDVQGTAGPVAPNDPIIAVGEAYTNSDGTLESDEELVVTWAEDDYTNVVSRTLTVDGQQQSQIGGPDSRGYCYSIIGTLPAGNHECKVELEYANGHTASTTTTFDVQGTAGPVAPNDPIIAVGEAYTNSDGTLESDEELVVTWAEDDYTNVVSRTLTVDGQQQSQIGGPDSRGYCYSIIGTLPAGNHECKVELEYANGHTASTTATFDVVSALTLTSAASPNGASAVITETDIEAIAAEAVSRLEEAYGGDAAPTLAGVSIEVTDLPGNMLGATINTAIYIDVDAAGYGWFVDSTPSEDEEYGESSGDLIALPGSEAEDHADLLTTVMHEMGHALGFDHTDEGLMAEAISLGVRRLPNNADMVDQLFASYPEDDDESDWS